MADNTNVFVQSLAHKDLCLVHSCYLINNAWI